MLRALYPCGYSPSSMENQLIKSRGISPIFICLCRDCFFADLYPLPSPHLFSPLPTHISSTQSVLCFYCHLTRPHVCGVSELIAGWEMESPRGCVHWALPSHTHTHSGMAGRGGRREGAVQTLHTDARWKKGHRGGRRQGCEDGRGMCLFSPSF